MKNGDKNDEARVHMNTSKACQLNEKEKKKNYNERVLKVEHGNFTPIFMSA